MLRILASLQVSMNFYLKLNSQYLFPSYATEKSLNEQFLVYLIRFIIIHQTHYEKSDWSRAFNQLTIACELDMINAISAADIAFIITTSFFTVDFITDL